MSLANLADLQAAIADFGTGRTDLTTSVINTFITLAESDIQNGSFDQAGAQVVRPLRVRSMETRLNLTLTGEFTALPSDYLEMREVRWSNQTGKPPLKWVSPEAFDSIYSAGDSGPATSWSVVGSEIRVGPGASASDILALIYYAKVPGLVANNTNWLLTAYPNVYLYGSLRHLAPYIGAMEMLGVWQSAYVAAIAGLTRSEERGSYSGTSLGVRSIGMTMT
jgi:hypothetical protein